MAVKAWGGPSGGGSAAGAADTTTDVVRSYQYARERDENSWDAIKRLGDEVAWRPFVVGRAFYYMSDEQLFKRRPRYELKPNSPAILDLAWDVDWGKPVSEATLTVALDHWGAPPGSVMLLSGWGPPDGRWLVTAVRRDWFSPTAEVTLKQPGKQQLEPAPERAQRTVSAAAAGGVAGIAAGTPDQAQQVYQAASSDEQLEHPLQQKPRAPSTRTRPARTAHPRARGRSNRPGSPSHPSPFVSGQYQTWGEPGPGKYFTVMCNPEHIWLRFNGIGSYWRFDTSPYGSGGYGPHMRSHAPPRPTGSRNAT